MQYEENTEGLHNRANHMQNRLASEALSRYAIHLLTSLYSSFLDPHSRLGFIPSSTILAKWKENQQDLRACELMQLL